MFLSPNAFRANLLDRRDRLRFTLPGACHINKFDGYSVRTMEQLKIKKKKKKNVKRITVKFILYIHVHRHLSRNMASEQVRHKPSCTSTEDDWWLEILDLESRGIVTYYPCSENKGSNQRCRLLVFS